MITIGRRLALTGAGALATPVLRSGTARAFSLSGSNQGVGCALLLGLGFPGLDQQAVVEHGAQAAAKAAGTAPPSAGIVSGLAQNVSQAGVSELFPVFCNPSTGPVTINFVTGMAQRPLTLSKSDEEIVRHDPARYLRENRDHVGGFLRRYGTGPNAGFQTIIVPGATFTVGGSTAFFMPSAVFLNVQPSAKGFYPTGISFSQKMDHRALLSLFAFQT
jgi:hypothetical protein